MVPEGLEAGPPWWSVDIENQYWQGELDVLNVFDYLVFSL